MAGHSKFKNIMHRKGAQDKKRAKLFSRLIREISVATKLGLPDSDSNPRLRAAVNNALSANMSKDSIEKAIKKNSDSSSNSNIEEIIYEGFGPGGVAIILDSFTDNKNRSVSEIRAVFNKYNGSLGTSGSVRHFFEKIGIILYSKSICAFEEIFDFSVSIGAKDLEETENEYEIITALENFQLPKSSNIEWKAKTLIDINEHEAEKLLRLIEKLEEIDDVQNIASNCNISDEILEKII